MRKIKSLSWSLALICAVFLCGCTYSETYGLNAKQQAQALKRYPLSPGLNYVKGEPGMNTLKGVTRTVLAPITLFSSEKLLKLKREGPYRKYRNDLVGEARSAVAQKHCDFDKFVTIANDYQSLDYSYELAFQSVCSQRGITDTMQKYWELKYFEGVEIMKKLLGKYEKQDENNLQHILYADDPSAAKIRTQCCDMVKGFIKQKKAKEEAARERASLPFSRTVHLNSTSGQGGLKINAFGPGIHQTPSGKPVVLKPDFGGVPGEMLEIKENAYGPGVHMDQYGRPVREYSPW